MIKKSIIAALILMLLLLIVFVGIAGYTANILSKSDREPLSDSPANWDLAYEPVQFESLLDEQPVMLHGWFIPTEGNRHGNSSTVVIVHGRGGNRHSHEAVPELTSLFVKRGYNVFLFDLRGHGTSEGDRFSLGYFEQWDVLGAIRYLRQTKQLTGDIGLMGFSMGAASVILATANTNDVGAVISDSGFARLRPIIDDQLPGESPLPNWIYSVTPLTGMTVKMARLMLGIDINAVNPVDIVERASDMPVFIIHGTENETIPVSDAGQLHAVSQGERNELWICEDAGHVDCYSIYPEEYTRRVLEFLDKNLDDGV